jgi:hypothetical protein
MSFLNPFLLFGLLSVSVPIIIHMLNRRKFDRVVWAAMRFLKVSVDQNQRRLKIEDLILLILRCALLAMLVMAVARPALKAAGGMFEQSQITAVFVLDNTMSMGQTNGVNTRFDLARLALKQALDALPNGSSAAVIFATDISDKVIAQPTFDLTLVGKTLQDAKLTDRASNLYRPITDAIDILKHSTGARKEIFLATDGQFLAFQQMPEILRALDESKSDIHTHFFLVDQPEASNLSISGLKMGSDIPGVGMMLPFDVEVSNWSHEPAENVRVTMHVDNDPPTAETLIDHIGPFESTLVTMLGKVRDDSFHTVTATLTPDHLQADDTRTLAIKGVTKVNVLLVDGNPGAEARDSEVFFLKHGLVPVPKAQADDYLIQCTTAQPGNLDTQRLGDYSAVALADVSDLPDREIDDLAAFVNRGGGLLIFPGDNLQPHYYNEHFASRGLLPAEFGTTDGTGVQGSGAFRLSPRSDHPIVSVFNDPQAGDMTAAHFFKRYLLTLTAPTSMPSTAPSGVSGGDSGGSASRVVLSFADKNPFIVERPLGKGRVIQFASTASTKWTDLPDHGGLWVPLLYRTVGWIVLKNQQELNVNVGDELVLHPPVEVLGKESVITSPGDTPDASGPRESRPVAMDSENIPTVTFSETQRAGEYDISVGDAVNAKYAVQADKNESDLRSISDTQHSQLAALADVVDYKAGGNVGKSLVAQRIGTEIWFPFAVAAMILATMETFLADWFSKAK